MNDNTGKAFHNNTIIHSFGAGSGGAVIGLITYAITAYTNNPATISIVTAIVVSYILFTKTESLISMYSATAVVSGIAIALVPIGTIITITRPTDIEVAIHAIQIVQTELTLSLALSMILVLIGGLLYRTNTLNDF